MARPGARSRAKKLSHHQIQHEMRRSYNETENDESPFLELPGEIRNEIYELAIPRDIIFDINDSRGDNYIEDSESNVFRRRCEIRKRESYERHFGITQVCRRVRKETLPVAYGTNTFKFQVGEEKEVVYEPGRCLGKRTMGVAAEAWILSRPVEALQHISRVMVHLYGPGVLGYGDGLIVLFDLKTLACRIIDLDDLDGCVFCRLMRGILTGDCERCAEKKRRKQACEKAVGSIGDMSMDAPTAKLLRLIQHFGNAALRPTKLRLADLVGGTDR